MSKYMFIVPSLSFGGAERAVSNFANELQRQKQEVVIVIYFRAKDEYHINEGIRIINLSGGTENEYNELSYLKKIKKLRRYMLEENADYILPFLPQVTIHSALAGLDLQKKIIHTIRNNPKESPRNALVRTIRNYIVMNSWKTIVQNETQKDYFPACIHHKIFVLGNPIPEKFFAIKRNIKSDCYIISAVGRLTEQKNYSLLLKSIKVVKKKCPQLMLQIYGEGSLKDALLNEIEKLGLSDFVVLMGRTNTIEKVYEKCDLYVLSSDFEGMPNALMEAMATGVPCISTDCPTGPASLIKNNENGILVPVGDIDALASAIEYMYKNRENAEMMGAKAKESVKNQCSEATIVEELVNICQK